MTGEDFVAKIALLKSILAPYAVQRTRIQLRCDSATSHNSEVVHETLARLKIELVIRQSPSFSKNSIADLDGKIGQFSDEFKFFLSQSSLKPIISAQLAAQKVNTTVNSATGHQPVELFLGRNPLGENIKIEAKKLLAQMSEKRAKSRNAASRRNLIKTKKKELKLEKI